MEKEELVYELIMLCKRWDLWSDMFISVGEKRYYADDSCNASGFRGISDVDIRTPPYEFDEHDERVCIWISGGVFAELVYMPYDYAGVERSEECLAYLLEHDKPFKLQYEREFNELLEEYLAESNYPDDTEFDDHNEYLEYREEFEEELKEDIKAELYIRQEYITVAHELLSELKALAKRYDMYVDAECKYDIILCYNNDD